MILMLVWRTLQQQLTNHAKFPMLVSNYDFTGTPMEYKHEPYKIFKKGKIKIGVFGLGVEMAGLVPENLSAGTKYLDPEVKEMKCSYFKKRKKLRFDHLSLTPGLSIF
jgi:5'-nucleotidase